MENEINRVGESEVRGNVKGEKSKGGRLGREEAEERKGRRGKQEKIIGEY